jgi:integrase
VGSKRARKGFYKRGGIWWYRTDPVEGVPRSTRSKTLEGAEEWLKERERRASSPSYTASHQETLGDWVERMLADKAQLRSGDTLTFYKQKCGHLIRFFGADCPLVRINSASVHDYKNARFAEGAHHYTISKEFTALRQVLKRAARAEVYSYDMSKLFPEEFGHGYTPRETVLTPEAEAALRRELEPEQWAAVAFILGTGARSKELFKAQPGDWNRDAGAVLLRGTKTAMSNRTIPVLSIAKQYLEEAFAHVPFTTLTPSGLRHALLRVAKKHGLDHISPNDLRRTCATRLIEAGCEPYFVSRITGHTDLRMLKKVYDRSALSAIAETLESQLATRKAHRDGQKGGA